MLHKIAHRIINYFKTINNIIFDVFSTKNDESNWKRNLAFISIAQFMTMAGMSSAIPFLPLYIRDLSISDPESAKLWSGIVFSGPYMLSIIATPLWGSLGDKYGQKPMIIRALFGLTLAVGLMGFVQNVHQLLALRIFQGAVSGMIASALAFVAADAPNNRSGYAIGILQSSLSAGNIFGPFMGGIISDTVGIRNVFLIVSSLCFLSGVLVLIFVIEKKKPKGGLSQSNFMGNIKYAINNKEIMKLMLLILIAQGAINYTNPIFPYFVEELGVPKQYLSSITGSLFAIVGLFSIMFAPTWGRRNDRKHYAKTIRVSTTIIGTAAVLHIFMPSYLYLYPLRAIIGIFFAAVVPTLFAALSKRIEPDIRGGVMGIASGATLLGSLVSFLSCGIVAAQFGIETSFLVSGAMLFLVAILSSKSKNN